MYEITLVLLHSVLIDYKLNKSITKIHVKLTLYPIHNQSNL